MVEVLNYKPPKTLKAFITDVRPGELFYDWVIGPYGSGKTTASFFKLVYMAKKQAKWADGIRRSRAVIVRNTAPQLKDTTIASWDLWFKDGQAGKWKATERNFVLRFDDVECEVLFRPLDTPDDIARVLSLEVTFAILDEFVQIPKEIVDALSARLGRFPSKKDGGATNWGMWGASNPDTEDCWWFDFLHGDSVERAGEDPDVAKARRALLGLPEPNVRYFVQPSGFADDAENLENLPPFEAGNHGYYTNQAKGKSEAWIEQYINANWGFSIAGKPVVPTFKEMHISKKKLLYNPLLPLIIGLDPGIVGSALIFGQEDTFGRLLILGELVQEGYGAMRLINERLRPYLRRRFPDANVIIAPDPAAANRTQTDEKSVVDVFRRYYVVKIETNNRLPLRLDAIESYTSRNLEVGPALLVDASECPTVIRALKGGWRYAMDPKKGIAKGAEPEKNAYSHTGDAVGYLARYFHRSNEREGRYAAAGQKAFHPPRSFGASYHMR